MASAEIFTKVQYAPEVSAYGTEGTSWNEISRVQSCNIDSNNSFIFDRGLGEGINANKVYWGQFEASGNITFDVADFTVLKHWIGPLSGSGTAGAPYILTEATVIEAAAEAATKLTPFSIERVNTDTETTADFAWGCVGNEFTLSGSLGSKLSCNANFVAQKTGNRATGQTYTPVTTSSYIMLGGSWKWGATPSALSGVREFEISYTNGLVTDTRSIESRFMNIPHFGQREYKFNFKIIMAQALAATLINDFYGLAAGGVYTPATGSVSSSPTASLEFNVALVNGNSYATIQLDECVLDKISKPAQLGGQLVLLQVEGTALKGLGNVPIKWWTV